MPFLRNLPLTLTPLDLIALAVLALAWFGVGRIIANPPQRRPSVSVLMKWYRREWMRQFVSRDPRIFDGNILATLREGTAFYASACLIALGGGLALLGNIDPLMGLARELEAAAIPILLWKLKLLLVLLLVANAYLKFVWSHRLFGWCAIMMAAVPNDPGDPRALPRALAAAEVNINAARNFNIGLRSLYFALGATGWLGGPWGLLAGTGVVVVMTLLREFASPSRKAILRDMSG
ncbi:MAG TPA: DUF599 domain-containing protein [Paracoccus sp. (in: a-proteobacteria)]|nr:DUF599 domain-containing protein [Paracoccus sp. (in: a-proteobacteria)]